MVVPFGKKAKVVHAKEDGSVDWDTASEIVTQVELQATVSHRVPSLQRKAFANAPVARRWVSYARCKG